MSIISKPYLKLQRELHEANPAYGASGHLHVGWVTRTAAKYGAQKILDYGCGKQTLSSVLPPQLKYTGYDPAFREIAGAPAQADLVVALDVMEHVEPTYLREVLKDIHRVTRFAALMTISTRPAGKILADGRNAHLIIEPPLWWLMQLDALWELQIYESQRDYFAVELIPR